MSQLEVDKIVPQSGTTLTIGDSGDTINFADGQNISIDTNTLYIDSTNNRVGIGTSSPSNTLDVVGGFNLSGNLFVDTNVLATDVTNNRVGINTSSPDRPLHVNGGTRDDVIKIVSTDGNCYIGAFDNQGSVYFGNVANSGAFGVYTGGDTAGNGSSEKMRIDSSGNVGIGTSSPASELEIESATPEIRIDATSGAGRNYKIHSDGNELYIEGIGSSGSLKIGEDGTYGVSIDLGTGGIQASDGIYLGGTGTANKLDDYETGTWTPTYVPNSGSFSSVTYASTAGEYTKIGNTVYFTFYIQTNAITVGSASGYVKIGGLPFAPGGGAVSNGGGTVINASFFAGDKPFYGTVGGSSEIFLYYSTGSTANDSLLDVSDLGTGGTDNVFQMMGTYITTA